MSLPQLERNQCALDAAHAPAARLRLLQDRAVLLARMGRIEEAEQAMAAAAPLLTQVSYCLQLRTRYVAAIQTYFNKRFGAALAQLRAVLAEANETCREELTSECESALALFLQREGDVRGAVDHARAVLDNPAATAEARYRALLALASLHEDAQEHAHALILYGKMRTEIDQMGDEVARASWLQRIATSSAAGARQAVASGEASPARVGTAIEALENSIRYTERVIGAPPVVDQLHLAEMHLLAGRPAQALQMYEALLPAADGGGFLTEATAAMADRAACLLRLDRVDDALAAAEAALKRVDAATPADIRAIVHGNLSEVLARLGRPAQAREHGVLATIAWDTYRYEQNEARRLLAGAVGHLVKDEAA